MSLDISKEIELAVRERAAEEGLSVEDLLARTFISKEVNNGSDSVERVRNLLSKWQAEDQTPLSTPIPTLPGESATSALFRTWDENDASMSDAEREQEQTLWQQIEDDLAKNRFVLDRLPRAS